MNKEIQEFCDYEMNIALQNIRELSNLLVADTELSASKTGEFVKNEIQLNRVHHFYYKTLKTLEAKNKSLIKALQLTVSKLLGIIKTLEDLYDKDMCKTDKLSELEKRKEVYKKQRDFLISLE
jgi:hypothetical protein